MTKKVTWLGPLSVKAYLQARSLARLLLPWPGFTISDPGSPHLWTVLGGLSYSRTHSHFRHSLTWVENDLGEEEEGLREARGGGGEERKKK